MKKNLKRSKLSVTFYVIACILLVYAVYSIFGSIAYLNTYFKTYGTSLGANLGDAIPYILSNSIVYLIYAILVFIGAVVYDEVRALNPANCYTKAELAAKEAEAKKKEEAKVKAAVEKASKKAAEAEAPVPEEDEADKAAEKEAEAEAETETEAKDAE